MCFIYRVNPLYNVGHILLLCIFFIYMDFFFLLPLNFSVDLCFMKVLAVILCSSRSLYMQFYLCPAFHPGYPIKYHHSVAFRYIVTKVDETSTLFVDRIGVLRHAII